MIRKEFVQEYVEGYGLTEDEVFELLMEYLGLKNDTYNPDFNLPDDFTYKKTAFEEWLERKLWVWSENFDSDHAPF